MKKATVLVLVILALLLMTVPAYAEHGNLGGIGITSLTPRR